MNKFRIVFSTMLLLTAISAKSQSVQRDSLAGIWVCVEATIPNDSKIPREEAEALNLMKSAIINSKFLFKTNGLFEWRFPKGVPDVFQGMDFLNNQKWSIDAKTSLIHIGDPKENLMQIALREKGETVYFIILDTPLLLQMKKE